MDPTGGGPTRTVLPGQSTPGRSAHTLALARAIRLFVLIFLAYGACAVLSWQSFGGSIGPAFFPAAGVTAAALLLTRRSRWPTVVAAIVLAEGLLDSYHGETISVVLGYVAANSVEPVVGAALVLAWCGGRPDLRRRRDLTAFLVGACVAGPLLGGVLGGWLTSRDGGATWLADTLHWAAGDGIGVLVVATPILLWSKQSHIVRARPLETSVVLLAAGVLSFAAFATEAPPSMLILPVLAWAAFRLDIIGAALTGVVIAVLSNLMTGWGRGMFADVDLPPSTRLALTQVFLAVVLVVALLIAQEVAGRTAAVRARESERRERLRLQALSGLAQQLSAALTPRDIGRAVIDRVLNEAGAKAVNLGLLTADGESLEWVVMEGYPPAVVAEYAGGVAMAERTLATDTVRTGQPIVVRTAGEYSQRYPATARWARISGSESVVGWPLTAGGEPVGLLLLMWSEPQSLNTAQLAYVSAVATMISQALVRARVYADEHARAAVLQAAVLPTTPAEARGLDICIAYEPADLAQGLGGDWYDVMPLPGGRTYLAVGDVVGHGLPAVEDMAQLRSASRALAHQGLSPGRVLAELNGFTRYASQGKFATMAVAVIESDGTTLSYCSAGHPPALLRKADSGEVVRLTGASGPVLGPVSGAEFPDATVHVEPGDTLLMYTDGLVERRGVDIDAGITRAGQLMAGWDPESPLRGVCADLQKSLAPRPRADDVCLLAVRFVERP